MEVSPLHLHKLLDEIGIALVDASLLQAIGVRARAALHLQQAPGALLVEALSPLRVIQQLLQVLGQRGVHLQRGGGVRARVLGGDKKVD
jgi:hypothetical protein